MTSTIAQTGIGAIRVYQWTLRPFIGSHCRFWPSCSEYAVEALRLHGAAKGTVMAAKRILRCNPWNEAGIDPVPGHETPPETNSTPRPDTAPQTNTAPRTARAMEL